MSNQKYVTVEDHSQLKYRYDKLTELYIEEVVSHLLNDVYEMKNVSIVEGLVNFDSNIAFEAFALAVTKAQENYLNVTRKDFEKELIEQLGGN